MGEQVLLEANASLKAAPLHPTPIPAFLQRTQDTPPSVYGVIAPTASLTTFALFGTVLGQQQLWHLSQIKARGKCLLIRRSTNRSAEDTAVKSAAGTPAWVQEPSGCPWLREESPSPACHELVLRVCREAKAPE